MSAQAHYQYQIRTSLPEESVSPVSTKSSSEDGCGVDETGASFENYCNQKFRTTDTFESLDSSSLQLGENYHEIDYNHVKKPCTINSTDIIDRELLLAPLAVISSGSQDHRPFCLADETRRNHSICDPDSRVTPEPSDHHSSFDQEEKASSTEKPWNPFCLQRAVLLALSAIFIVCMLVTAILYNFSLQHNGLSAEDESRHYGWKYGPTAVLTVILYVWYSIDLSVRSLLPWQELRNGPKPADVTLLLDYMSPILVVSFWSAARNRHWAVVLTIIGRFLLLATIAFSTALFVLGPTEVTVENVPLMIPEFNTKPFQLDKVGPFSGIMYYGVNFGNLASPLGVFPDACVPPPAIRADAQSIPSSAKLQATVTGLRFDTQCEILDIKDYDQFQDYVDPLYNPDETTYWTTNITAPSCHIHKVTAAMSGRYFLEIPDFVANRHGYEAKAESYACNLPWNYHDTDRASWGEGPLVNVSNTAWYNISNANRILLIVSDMSLTGNETFALEQLTAVLCNPSYTVGNYSIIYDGVSQKAQAGDFKPADNATSARYSSSFPQSAIALAVMRAVAQVHTVDPYNEKSALRGLPSFFELLKLQSNGSIFKEFLDGQLLRSMSLEVINGVAALLAYEIFLKDLDTEVEIEGSASFTQDRLHVTELSTAIMCFTLGALAVISAGLAFLAPKDVVHLKPGSVLATASSMNLTPSAMEILGHLGHVRDKNIRTAITPYLFDGTRSRKDQKLALEISKESYTTPLRSATSSETNIRWWRPLGGKDWFLFVAFGTPLVLLSLLEMFQKHSDDQNGFVRIQSQWDDIIANFVPSLISISIGAMFASIVAACAVFAPYSEIVKRPMPSSRSVAINYVTQTGLMLEYSSLTNKHFGLAIITIAQLIATGLTIVLSGLYSTVEVPFHTDVSLHKLDAFNISDNIPFSNPNAGLLTKLITYYGLEFPTWTYDDIALPRVGVDSMSSLQEISNATIKSRLRGLQSDLNCTAISSSLFRMSIVDPDVFRYSPYSDIPKVMHLNFAIHGSIPASKICDKAEIKNDSNNMLELSQSFLVRGNSTSTFFGKALPLDWILQNSFSQREGYNEIVQSLSCPSIAIILGSVTALPLPKSEWKLETEAEWTPADADIGTLLCSPKLKEIDVDVTFRWPAMDISEPPQNRVSYKWLENPLTGNSNWGGTTSLALLESAWESLSNTNNSNGGYGYTQDGTSLDPFIQTLISGKYKVPLEQISGENNTQALLQHTRALWGRYMAQSISQNMRVDNVLGSPTQFSDSKPNSESSSLPRAEKAENAESPAVLYPATAEASSSGSLRKLKQNASSKLTLQLMLGFMSLSVVAMRAMISFRQVLPHNPCSIAGTLTLVVDGNLHNMDTSTAVNHGNSKGRKRYTRLRTSQEAEEDDQDDEQKYIMGWWNDGGIPKFGVRHVEDTEES